MSINEAVTYSFKMPLSKAKRNLTYLFMQHTNRAKVKTTEL